MGKRTKDEDEGHRLRKKIRKLEKKLKKIPEKSIELDSEDSSSTPQPQQVQDVIQLGEEPSQTQNEQIQLDEDILPNEEILPEEFLLALGNEGEEKIETGVPIRAELALRWSRLMANGLGKEAKDNILKKYPIPENFQAAVAPVMNPEILSSLNELSIKRDKRIMARQNLTGKMMACLGKALTSILKGDINSKNLIEEINDAAKLAAEIHYEDSSSRKFFALAGANQTVKEAVRNEKPDELLFGKSCAEKIKSAQAVQKTGSQIKSIDTPKAPPKPHQTSVKKQGNWRGPPQHQQQHRRGRGGHHQPPRKHYSQPHPYQKDQRRQTRPRGNYRR